MAWALAQDDQLVDVVTPEAPALVSVSYGPYERWIPPLQASGIAVATQVGTLDEARMAEDAGVDVIVARGGEGGGHGRSDVATLPLLQSVLDAVKVPVLAAGGIGTARGLAAVLAAGCAGAWVGTAFVTYIEAATSPGARDRLACGEGYRHRVRTRVRRRPEVALATSVRRSSAPQRLL